MIAADRAARGYACRVGGTGPSQRREVPTGRIIGAARRGRKAERGGQPTQIDKRKAAGSGAPSALAPVFPRSTFWHSSLV